MKFKEDTFKYILSFMNYIIVINIYKKINIMSKNEINLLIYFNYLFNYLEPNLRKKQKIF